MADLANISSFFETRINQFEEKIYYRTWLTNPFSSLVPTLPFDLEMGLVPTVITATCDLPTSFPFSETALALSNGTGNASCNPSVTTINGGYVNRTYQLYVKAFQTPVFCLTDLQFKFQWVKQAEALEKQLTQYVTQYQGDWHRVQNIGMIETKVSTGSGSTLDFATNSNYDFTAVDAPVATLSWRHLSPLYDLLAQKGGEEFAVGHSAGAPVYALNVGPSVKRELFLSNTIKHEDVNFADMGKGVEGNENFTPRGTNKAIGGFVPNVDLWPIRYAADGTTAIYPFINSAVTVGTRGVPNPDYRPISQGGLAKYEAFSIMARNVYSRRPRPVGPTTGSMQSFNAVPYSGEVRWINNPDMSTNALGNFGFYRIDIQQAAMPEYPELGFTGLTLLPEEDANSYINQ